MNDPVMNAMRDRIIRSTPLPKWVKKNFKTTVKDGVVTLTKKKER